MADLQIFISYRRDDSAGYARALYDELARQWGADRIFIDVDDISAGQSFAEVIREAVIDSKVLLVLIGPRWRGDRAGQAPRLDDPDDLVRQEVASGLAAGMQTIPVLLNGTPMPSAAQLPEPLRSLAQRNAFELSDTRFAADLKRLHALLQSVLGAPQAGTRPQHWHHSPWLAAGALAALALALAAVAARVGWWPQRPPAQAQAPSVPAALAGRAELNGTWQAEVEYDWPNSRTVEHFDFIGTGSELFGSASFLGVRRGLLEGRVDAEGLHFTTRSLESTGGADTARESLHRYRARWVGGELRFVMQTEGGSSPHVPVEFVARRVVR